MIGRPTVFTNAKPVINSSGMHGTAARLGLRDGHAVEIGHNHISEDERQFPSALLDSVRAKFSLRNNSNWPPPDRGFGVPLWLRADVGAGAANALDRHRERRGEGRIVPQKKAPLAAHLGRVSPGPFRGSRS